MKRTWILVGVAFLVTAALAYFVAPLASGKPDELTRLTGKESPSGYRIPWVKDDRQSTGLAGVAGVAIVFGLGCGTAWLLSRRKKGAA